MTDIGLAQAVLNRNKLRWPAAAALIVAMCAGMVDLVAMPVWTGTLITQYHFNPQKAGGLAAVFLISAVVASVILAPLFHRIPRRAIVVCGFLLATIAFFEMSQVNNYGLLTVLHALAGLGVGAGLSITMGSMGRSKNPHRMYAIAGLAIGIFSTAYLGTMPIAVSHLGGPFLFKVFALIEITAAVVAATAFPAEKNLARENEIHQEAPTKFSRGVWFGILGVACLSLTQGMTFTFFQSIGIQRGFGLSAVSGALMALGLVNMFPAPLAGVLENKLKVEHVVIGGPLLQGAAAIVLTMSTMFLPYAVAGILLCFFLVFTNTFAFGLLARLDRSARAVAATPATTMTGTAIGSFLGGTLAKSYGYSAIGFAAVATCLVCAALFTQARR